MLVALAMPLLALGVFDRPFDVQSRDGALWISHEGGVPSRLHIKGAVWSGFQVRHATRSRAGQGTRRRVQATCHLERRRMRRLLYSDDR